MSIFTIDNENNITAHASSQEATLVEGAGVIQFNSQASPANAPSDWPLSRFVEIWNSIPGNAEVTKFQDRKKAVARIWKAIQSPAERARSEAQEGGQERKRGRPAMPPRRCQESCRQNQRPQQQEG